MTRPWPVNLIALITFSAGTAFASFNAAPSTAQPAAVGDWIQITPNGTPPSPRREHCAVYDVAHDRMIVFGGTPGGTVGETWQLDWSPSPTWTQLHPSLSPNALGGSSAIYDPVRRRMIIFGGWTATSAVTDEVWTLSLDDPTAWVQLGPQGTRPSPRSFAVTAYDPVTDRMILFSGNPGFNDVWALSLGDTPTWTRILPSGFLPRVRWGSSGVLDPELSRLVISDGFPRGTPDAWSLSLGDSPAWTQLPPPTFRTSSLVGASATYDPSGPTMLVYGGYDYSNNPDTWVLPLSGSPLWSILPHGTALPPSRQFHSAVYRAVTSQMVVFGGFEGVNTFRNDVWSLQLGVAAPKILGFAPVGGIAGDTVIVSGQYLSQVTSVQFGESEATFNVVDDLTLAAIVPADATTGPIEVSSAGGADTTDDAFFVGPPPIVTAVGADSARIGESVDVHGLHFLGATRVMFGGSGHAPFTVLSDTVLTATIDSAAVSGPISVANPTGIGTSTFNFLVIGLNPRPRLTSVYDVSRDQGGRVLLRWEASDFDKTSNHTVTAYRVWRRAPLQTLSRSASTSSARQADGSLARYLPHPATEFWESLTEIPAALLSGYAHVAPTLSDSIAGFIPFTAFAIQALTLDRNVFYFSNIDSGYSVDNLAPSAPSRFTAVHEASVTHLHWDLSSAPDFATFHLHQGTSADFTPDPTNLIVATVDTGFVDPGPAGRYYKLSAMDLHGNESPFARVGPVQSIGVPSDGALSFTLADVRPNPTSGRTITVEFTLPIASSARLELLDVTGRVVVRRDVGTLGAGHHATNLAHGLRLAPGVYSVRLVQGANIRTTRVAVLD